MENSCEEWECFKYVQMLSHRHQYFKISPVCEESSWLVADSSCTTKSAFSEAGCIRLEIIVYNFCISNSIKLIVHDNCELLP